MVGLWSAVFVGFITAAFGGRPGMICGATGAIAIVAAQAVTLGNSQGGMGMEYLLAALLFAGVIQITIGLLKMGRFIRLVPHPVMMGFVNGLAIVILLGQRTFFKDFVGLDENGQRMLDYMPGGEIALMFGLIALTMAIIVLLPKLTKAVPPSLIAIIIVGLITTFFIDSSRTISDVLEVLTGSSEIQNSFPSIASMEGIPWGSLEFYKAILPISLTIALVGLIESLLTLQLIDEITDTRGQGNRECLAQGAANIASGLFGGMGGCATIGQSLINMKSGGRGRTSGIVGALTLLVLILFGSELIMKIPIAALVGVMFMIVISTFEWSTFKTVGTVPKTDILVILVVTLVTVFMHNLALAVGVGLIVSALVFAFKSSQHVQVEVVREDENEKVYAIEGLIYFGSVADMLEEFQAKSDVQEVVLDFEKARVCDLSGIEAINALGGRYRAAGKKLRVRHLSPDCRRMLERANPLVEIEILPDDPEYSVARLRGSQA